MRRRALLDVAIEREDWEAAALCLLLGIAEAARKLPPETLEEMIAALGDVEPRTRDRRGHTRGPA